MELTLVKELLAFFNLLESCVGFVLVDGSDCSILCSDSVSCCQLLLISPVPSAAEDKEDSQANR